MQSQILNITDYEKIKILVCGHSYMGRIFPKAGHTPDSCSHPDYLRMDRRSEILELRSGRYLPFVANSPFMSFFYAENAPEYKEYKLKEGEFDPAKHQWHETNRTYVFSRGLGILIMTIGILTFLGIFSPKLGLAGAGLAIIMTLGTLSFLVTTPEVWVPDLGSGEHGFPLLSGAGRLVIKDTAILAGAIVVLADSAKGVLNQIKKTV